MASVVRPTLPVSLDLVGAQVLVVGGGAEAVDKTQRLVTARARTTVVSPQAADPLQAWAAAGTISWLARPVRRGDVRGCRAVIDALAEDDPMHDALQGWARRSHALLWVHDQPDRSDFAMPALLSRGLLSIAVATSNASPSVASTLRKELERMVDRSELSDFLSRLGSFRDELRQREPDKRRRAETMRAVAAGVTLSGTIDLPRGWRERLEGARRALTP